MGTRRKSRELALQMLFQADVAKQAPDEVRRSFWAERGQVEEDVRGFADDLFRVASDRGAEIDKTIESHAEHWRMERMPAVDRNILRLGAYELSIGSDIPFAVASNEAVELGKRFGSEESGAFINGILDRISEIDRKKTTAEGAA